MYVLAVEKTQNEEELSRRNNVFGLFFFAMKKSLILFDRIRSLFAGILT